MTATIDTLPKGSRITCHDCGSLVCVVAVDEVKRGGRERTADFDNWQQTPPKSGELIGNVRCKCGGTWITSNGPSTVIHVEGFGWWPGIVEVPEEKPNV